MSTTTPHKQHKPLDPSILTIVEDTPPSERTTHAAQCHCGTVKFNVTLKWPFPKYPVNVCSCSICHQVGYVLVYPARRDVVFTEGYETLQSYAFNTKTKSHKFCPKCGTSLLIDFQVPQQGESDPRKDILAVNVRTFKDLDLDSLDYTFFDGKNWNP